MVLTFERTGKGPALVLIHGLGSARTVWKPVTSALAARFDVIAVDLPGHGQTPWVRGTPMDPLGLAGHVRDTLDALGVARVHVLGNSLGAQIGFALCGGLQGLIVFIYQCIVCAEIGRAHV